MTVRLGLFITKLQEFNAMTISKNNQAIEVQNMETFTINSTLSNIIVSPLFSESKPIPIINNKASSLHGYCSSFITNWLQKGFLLIIMHCFVNFRHWLEAIKRRKNQYDKKTREKIRTSKTIPLRVTRQKASSTLNSALA